MTPNRIATFALLAAALAGCTTSTRSSPAPTCDTAGATDDCQRCALTACCAELDACTGDASCSAVVGCLDDCGSDQTCGASCLQAYPSGASLLETYASCQSNDCASSCGSSGSGSGSGGSTGTTGSQGSTTPAPCSTDGSDAVVAGTYGDKSSDGYGDEESFTADVFVPNCQVCVDYYQSTWDFTPLYPTTQTWSSAWSQDHASIILTYGGAFYGTVTPDGSTLTIGAPSGGALVFGRFAADDPDLRSCGGHVVVSSTSW